MAFSKAYLYKKQDRKVARIAKALGHPARVNILNQLRFGELSFRQLCELHPINKATMSTHLKALRLAGLIDCSICGNYYYYHSISENHPKWVELILQGMDLPSELSKAA